MMPKTFIGSSLEEERERGVMSSQTQSRIPPRLDPSALFALFLGALGEISPEEDYGDEKHDYDYIFDAISLEEIHIPVEITHHRTSVGIESLNWYFSVLYLSCSSVVNPFPSHSLRAFFPGDVHRVDLGLPRVHRVNTGLPQVG
jgi:hypothetical protein